MDHSDFPSGLARTAGLSLHRFPETNLEADLIESLVEMSMQNLSMDEHERILFEIHGFAQPEEDEETVERSLKEVKTEILKIDDKDKRAYLLAKSMNEAYVSSRHFLLMFLRYERFQPRAAALKLVRHFEEKQRLFGDGEVLGRNVRQSDLTPKDLGIIQLGLIRIHPSPDAAGRTIFLASAPPMKLLGSMFDHGCGHRGIWYLTMKALQDESSQKNGFVSVYVMGTDAARVSLESLRSLQRISSILPSRKMGGHFCYSDPNLRPYVAGFQLFAEDDKRNRLRVHFGTQEEIVFKLQTFGIPSETFKFRADGSLDTSEQREWLEAVRVQEEKELEAEAVKTQEETGIIVPRRFDVLFGKSNFARHYAGTQRALQLVEKNFEEYEKLGKTKKTRVAQTILLEVHKWGGRFLRQSEGGLWETVSDEEARKKIAHWFRHSRYKRTVTSDGGSPVDDHGSVETKEAAKSTKSKRTQPEEATEDENSLPVAVSPELLPQAKRVLL